MFKKIGNLIFYLVANLIFGFVFNLILFKLIKSTPQDSILIFDNNNDVNTIVLYYNILFYSNVIIIIISISILIRIGYTFHQISDNEVLNQNKMTSNNNANERNYNYDDGRKNITFLGFVMIVLFIFLSIIAIVFFNDQFNKHHNSTRYNINSNNYESELPKNNNANPIEDNKSIPLNSANNQSDITILNNSNSNYTELDEQRIRIIKNHIIAEDSKIFSDIEIFFSVNIQRYYDLYYPKIEDLKKRYDHLWGIVMNPKSVIKQIEKETNNTYLVTFDYEYYGSKNNTHKIIRNEITYYVFDENNKIISLYDNSK